SLTFDAEGLPALPEGWTRDFIIYSVGWVKDGDLNTAHGNTVGPLPYHGIVSYPYGNNDVYPDEAELKRYHQEYNTRKVTSAGFKSEIAGNK
ncbi:MAG: hypothetical protein OEX02_17710, partial [Cyclobacteriaceae bacterium]|nr:hypothetical protein [Cyclobacteriaceae bacterium]